MFVWKEEVIFCFGSYLNHKLMDFASIWVILKGKSCWATISEYIRNPNMKLNKYGIFKYAKNPYPLDALDGAPARRRPSVCQSRRPSVGAAAAAPFCQTICLHLVTPKLVSTLTSFPLPPSVPPSLPPHLDLSSFSKDSCVVSTLSFPLQTTITAAATNLGSCGISASLHPLSKTVLRHPRRPSRQCSHLNTRTKR